MSDVMLAKVRKLLAKAEDPAATEHEARVYTTKAAELIAAYGIDRALLAQADPASDPVGDRVVVVDPPYAQDKADLLGGVATQLRCRAVQRTSFTSGRKELSLHLFGFEADLLRAEILYTSLLLQATAGVTRARAPRGEQPAAFRRSWLRGFTYAVVARLAEAEDRARVDAEAARPSGSPTPSVALVLADRSAAVSSALRAHYPRARQARARSLSGSGGHQGWSAGQRADLGTTHLGATNARRSVTGGSPRGR
ncbi:MAG TPA: DUF2786 domain-containing protein [Nocardioidaceae bacterium]|nr:DUF2786 domain-containing protein [Nocardioidaceae bacterium]